MTCKDILDKLQDYLDGDLKEKITQQIKVHISECPGCREEYQILKKLGDLYRNEPIRLPSEADWQKTWKTLEMHITEPKLSLFRSVQVTWDSMVMRYLSPRPLALRVALTSFTFAFGMFLGAYLMSSDGNISQRIVKIVHRVEEVPVVQEKEVVKYLEREIPKPQIVERVVEKPKVIYLASASFEPAPVFPANDKSELAGESGNLWSPKFIVDNQIEKIQNELEPTFVDNNSDHLIRLINATR